MRPDSIVLWITTTIAVVTAGTAIWQNWRKPKLDAAQAAKLVIDADVVKTEIERAAKALNASRDLRVLDLEKWADKMRPTLWDIKVRDEILIDLIRAAYVKLGMPVPDIPAFPLIPDFPPPRSFDAVG